MTAGWLAARHVWLGPGTWLSPGWLRWNDRGRLVSLRRARRGERVADVLLVPGLVDAHAHLQLSPLATAVAGPFVDWLRAVIAARLSASAAQLRAAAVAGLRELWCEGATAVGEIDSSGLSPGAFARVPLAGRCYQEVTGFHLERAAARQLVAARRAAGTAACPGGLSPHAPYSVGAPLFAAATARARHLSIHVAEVEEEQQLLRSGRGPFADLLRELGRLPPDYRPPGIGAVRWLDRLGLLRPTTQLVHGQALERGDAAAIASRGAPVTVCPGTIAWFGRPAPPVVDWLGRGICVALGTDSRASNERLSMRRELALAAHLWPALAPEQLLAMATAHGGRAIGRAGLGTLRVGGRADLVCVAAGGSPPARLLAEFVHGVRPHLATLVAGVGRTPAGRSWPLPRTGGRPSV